MDSEPTQPRKFSLKQRSLLFFYKLEENLYQKWSDLKQKVVAIFDSFLLYILLFCIGLFIIQKILICTNVNLTQDFLSSLGFSIAGIIGASIAIIFSFSTFILQSTADLFSTRYLNKFIEDRKEKRIFWILVLLTIFSILIPVIVNHSVIEILISILFIAFLLIYSLHKELRKRINPETTLIKISDDAFHQLKKANKVMIKYANIQNKVFDYSVETRNLTVSIQYKSSPNWNILILENVKYLYEIGLRLLSKNEINSFNLTLQFIHDIFLQHLSLRNGYIARIPSGLWGTYTFEDEGFTTKILEYLESITDRVIQDKRKENIYFLLSKYENLIANVQYFKYSDRMIGSKDENPILSLILGYYIGLIDKLIQSKEFGWVWESVKSVSKTSNLLLAKGYNHFNYSQLSQVVDRLMISCLTEKQQENFLKELVKIYFTQIKVCWNKYSENEILWSDIFKNLKKGLIALSTLGGINVSINELHMDFHEWMVNTINSIFDIVDSQEQEKLKDAYIKFMEEWSDFLLDLARDTGLENKNIGLPIIQSVENNLRIIYGIKNKFGSDINKLYETQFNTLSWYFTNTESVDSSFLFNLEKVENILLEEIDSNLDKKKFEIDDLINSYIRLTQQHFEKVTLGHGYNHPRVIEKLVCLGLILTKYKYDTKQIIDLISALNDKYLELNKAYFQLKSKTPGLVGPNQYQLCKEIHDLENNLFSYSSSVITDTQELLKSKISKGIWNKFIKQIKCCEGVEYTTVEHF